MKNVGGNGVVHWREGCYIVRTWPMAYGGIVVQGERESDIVVTMVFASWIYCNYNT